MKTKQQHDLIDFCLHACVELRGVEKAGISKEQQLRFSFLMIKATGFEQQVLNIKIEVVIVVSKKKSSNLWETCLVI